MTALCTPIHDPITDRYRCTRCNWQLPVATARPFTRVCTFRGARAPAVHTAAGLSRLAIVTCHFDPHHSAMRLANYHWFAKRLRCELWTVEATLPGELPQLADQPRHLHYEVDARLWHKERLLNLAINQLPPDVDAVGWFDSDVVYCRLQGCGCRGPVDGAIREALGRWPVIQPWARVEWLGSDGKPVNVWKHRWAPSMAARNQGRDKPSIMPSWSHPGFAWAARRETLDAIGGLYDRHPLGGADTMMAAGFWDQHRSPYFNQYNAAMVDDWRRWAVDASRVVAGRVGYLDRRISHLYHGSIASRQYGTRIRDICGLGLDPARHLTDAPNGTLTWHPDTPREIISYASDYFVRREE